MPRTARTRTKKSSSTSSASVHQFPERLDLRLRKGDKKRLKESFNAAVLGRYPRGVAPNLSAFVRYKLGLEP